MTTLITDAKDERLVVRVYRNAPDGLVRAMEDINVLTASLRAALEKLTKWDNINREGPDEPTVFITKERYDRLTGQLSIFTQAIGLMTTIKGTMVMRPDDPIGMAQEVAAYVADLCPRAERDAWKESAEQFSRNEDYYRGLVVQIGKVLGPAVYVSDDGTVQEDVLCAKVPELVGAALSRAEAAEAQLELAKRFHTDEYRNRLELEVQLCRAREILYEAQHEEEDEYVGRAAEALSSSGPCRHEEEARRLKEARLGVDSDAQVFFYERDFYIFSNFSAFSVRWKDFIFSTSEHVYHWEKFPGNADIRCAILTAPSAHEALKIAEKFSAERRPDWFDVRVGIMREILFAKASQHEYVHRKLLATGDRELIEDSWRDDFWGWGSNRDGRNTLGKLWMEVRTELRRRAGGKE